MITREWARISARIGAVVAIALAASLSTASAQTGDYSPCSTPETAATRAPQRGADCPATADPDEAYLLWAVNAHRAALVQARLPAVGSVRPAVLIQERPRPRAGACGDCGPLLLP